MQVVKQPNPEQDPKLKMASMEIKAILEKYDVAGFAILHLPGHLENVIKISPSFSCVGLNEVNQLQIHPPLVDPTDEKPAKKKIADTVNMLFNLKTQAMKFGMILNMAEQTVRKHFNLVPPPGNPRPGSNGTGKIK